MERDAAPPPYSIEMEMAVLGAAMLNMEALDMVVSELEETDFYHRGNREIFKDIQALYKTNSTVDIATVTTSLRGRNALDECGGATYVSGLIEAVPTPEHVDTYIAEVKKKATLRRLLDITSNVYRACYEDNRNPDSLIEYAETKIFELVGGKNGNTIHHSRHLAGGTLDDINKAFISKKRVTGLATGFHALDEITTGLHPSFILLAARPSMGKTALAMNIVENLAIRRNIPVGVFSVEMSREQLIQRMVSSRARVDAQRIRSGSVSFSDWTRILQAAAAITAAPIYICDDSLINPFKLKAIARRMRSRYGVELIIIDYMQLLVGEVATKDRQAEITQISRHIKGLVKELGVPIMVLSQLNREVEQRPSKVPQLSDLRESGSLEQDADIVMLLVRQEFYNPDRQPGIADMFIAKQRNGPVGKLALQFISSYTRFENMTRPGRKTRD